MPFLAKIAWQSNKFDGFNKVKIVKSSQIIDFEPQNISDFKPQHKYTVMFCGCSDDPCEEVLECPDQEEVLCKISELQESANDFSTKRIRIKNSKFTSEEETSTVRRKTVPKKNIWINDSLTLAEKLLEDSKTSKSQKYIDCSDEEVDINNSSPMKETNSIVCPTCNEEFGSQTDLDEHVIDKHNDKKNNSVEKVSDVNVPIPVTCYLCDKEFKFRVALDHHLKKVHDQKNSNNDSGNYSGADDMDEGVQFNEGVRYDGEKVIPILGNCKIDLTKGDNIPTHKNFPSHNATPQKKQIASKISKPETRDDLKKDSPMKKRSKVSNKGDVSFSCDICSKKFPTRIQLISHLKFCKAEDENDDANDAGSESDLETPEQPKKKQRITLYLERKLRGEEPEQEEDNIFFKDAKINQALAFIYSEAYESELPLKRGQIISGRTAAKDEVYLGENFQENRVKYLLLTRKKPRPFLNAILMKLWPNLAYRCQSLSQTITVLEGGDVKELTPRKKHLLYALFYEYLKDRYESNVDEIMSEMLSMTSYISDKIKNERNKLFFRSKKVRRSLNLNQ